MPEEKKPNGHQQKHAKKHGACAIASVSKIISIWVICGARRVNSSRESRSGRGGTARWANERVREEQGERVKEGGGGVH